MTADLPSFAAISDLVRAHAQRDPAHIALRQDDRSFAYGALDALMDRVAAALQRDGVASGQAIAICAGTSIEYSVIFLGALRAGAAVAPLPISATAESIAGMIADCDARFLFLDAKASRALAPVRDRIDARCVALDDGVNRVLMPEHDQSPSRHVAFDPADDRSPSPRVACDSADDQSPSARVGLDRTDDRSLSPSVTFDRPDDPSPSLPVAFDHADDPSPSPCVEFDPADHEPRAPVSDRDRGPPVAFDRGDQAQALEAWLAPEGARPAPVAITPEMPFNIIYSSGTTGTPKGIVQPHAMRWAHIRRSAVYGYGPDTVTLLATPLYSNTTLVVFFPTIAAGGTVVTMAKFDASAYLALAQQLRATHTMLVPVQYQRIMALADFDRHDLRSFRYKFCTSAPFSARLKADVLARWPGGLVEFYGMTEGGGTCILAAHERPDKLHTVGQPAEGHDIRLIDEQGREAGPGEAGEVVGHSPGMMSGYHGRPDLTADAEWFDASGKRFIRTGDVARFDHDGFLVLMDRRKDMIISGGFNIYPSDLEAVLATHPDVIEVAVIGVPSEQWGESPIAFVVLRVGAQLDAGALRGWANARLGKTQRLADVRLVDALPRSAIGKVMKRELRALAGGSR